MDGLNAGKRWPAGGVWHHLFEPVKQVGILSAL